MTEQPLKDTKEKPKDWIDNAPDPLQTEEDVAELERMIAEEKNKKTQEGTA